jgi:hypothetical protein
MWFVLQVDLITTIMLSWIFIVMKQQDAVRHVAPLKHSDADSLPTGRKILSGLIVLHLRYQCRRSDYWAEDTTGTNSPPPEVSMLIPQVGDY